MLDEAGDVVGAGALVDVHDLAGVGIGYDRKILLPALMGRLVDDDAGGLRQIGCGNGEIDITLANRCHSMPALADDACDSGKGHMLREIQHESLE